MLDQQTRQELQTNFEQNKPQLKGQFSGLSDQDWEAAPEGPGHADRDDQPEDGSGPRAGRADRAPARERDTGVASAP